MTLEQRLTTSYLQFKQNHSEEEHQRFMNLIKEVHENAWDTIEGKQSGLDKAEFAHALSIIAPEQSSRGQLPRTCNALPTKVEKDGSLLGTSKWELLDPGWVEAVAAWLDHFDHQADFNTNPATVSIPDRASLCIAGDWGTGYWRNNPLSPAEKVRNAMVALQPDLYIHLGDVYYAGSADQEQANLVALWPTGTEGIFTLNSNHEMYDGAIAYFKALQTTFKQQQGCSYFALANNNWLIVGLDSSYHADKWNLFMDGDIGLAQQQWLAGLPAKQGIILLSHHNGYDLQGRNQTALYQQVMEQLKGSNGSLRYDRVVWYWGHLHNVAAYAPLSFSGIPVNTRCIGHGAVPYGNTSELEDAPQVLWYEKENANDPAIPVRVLNGFAQLRLEGSDLIETLVDENGSVKWEHAPST